MRSESLRGRSQPQDKDIYVPSLGGNPKNERVEICSIKLLGIRREPIPRLYEIQLRWEDCSDLRDQRIRGER